MTAPDRRWSAAGRDGGAVMDALTAASWRRASEIARIRRTLTEGDHHAA